MRTIALIDPSPKARSTLAEGFRSEFNVLENGTLTPAIAAADTRLIVASADAVTPEALTQPPFAALPCLILGSFPRNAAPRAAPLVVVERPTDSAELLDQVRALLDTAGGRGASAGEDVSLLEPPFYPIGLTALVQRAARAHAGQLPILITGERGTGKRTVARALHRIAEYGTFVRVTPLTATGFAEGRTADLLRRCAMPVTLVADGIDAFTGDAQSTLVECLAGATLAPAGAARPLWLVATTTADLGTLADAGRFDSALAARLGEIVIEVPPLRSRRRDISLIAEKVLRELSGVLGSRLRLSPDAVACLERHPWPGNLAELLAVLRRTAVFVDGESIGQQQLEFASSHSDTAMAPERFAGEEDLSGPETRDGCHGERASHGTAASPPSPPQIELILAELAHELKNPMVTIKTFAQHLPSLLEDAELRERFSALTDEAITRMDGLLENLLDFARLGHPRPEPVALTVLLDGILAGVNDKIEQRGARVRREGWELDPRVVVDEAHLSYALGNLFESLASELPRHHELAVRVGDNGTIGLRFVGTGGVTAKLQGFLYEGGGVPAPAALPLRFTLARAVIARNGGRIAVDAGKDDETLVTVALPGCAESALTGGGGTETATKMRG